MKWSAPDYSSVGSFYGMVTEHLGWKANDEEGTVMALAAMGDPSRFRSVMEELLHLRGDTLVVEPSLLPPRIRRVREGFSDRFKSLVCPSRRPDEEIQQVHRDLAAAAQERLEELVADLAALALARAGESSLVLTGGVAENCVANGRLLSREIGLTALYVPPAPGDAGTALGAALDADTAVLRSTSDQLGSPFVGDRLDVSTLSGRFRRLSSGKTPNDAARQLLEWCDEGQIVALVRGRFEFGPRALGNRSIIASPFTKGIGLKLNRMVKFREPFRPFAPVVREESVERIFSLPRPNTDTSSMSVALPVRQGMSALHEIVHANGLARLQTINRARHPILWESLRLMEERGDAGVLINTSLNVKGQPICGTSELLEEFAAKSAVTRFLIEDDAFEYDGT